MDWGAHQRAVWEEMMDHRNMCYVPGIPTGIFPTPNLRDKRGIENKDRANAE